jgi:hypothetical protein
VPNRRIESAGTPGRYFGRTSVTSSRTKKTLIPTTRGISQAIVAMGRSISRAVSSGSPVAAKRASMRG